MYCAALNAVPDSIEKWPAAQHSSAFFLQIQLHSLESSFKWNMAPWITIFLHKQVLVVFHFHNDSRECKGYRLDLFVQ